MKNGNYASLPRPSHLTGRDEVSLDTNQQSQHTRLRGLTSVTDRWFVLVIALVLAAILSIYAFPEHGIFVYLRYVLGVPFVLYLPGYSLTMVLFEKRKLEVLERIALSMTFSMVLASITGIMLNYSPWGIKLDPIVGSLSALTIAFSLMAQLVRRTSP